MNTISKFNSERVIAVLFFCFLAFIVVNGSIRGYLLNTKYLFSIGKITDAKPLTKSTGTKLSYTFFANSKLVQATYTVNGYTLSYSECKHLLNQPVPVVYNPDYPQISTLLLTREDNNRYDYVPSDSLAWINDYVDSCK
jgi:hypothetical protein